MFIITFAVAADYAKCREAAKACLQLAETTGDLGNFRLCASFNCPPGIPFFPSAYHDDIPTSATLFDEISERQHATITIGLECGDLLFLAFHGAENVNEGSDNLFDIMKQICSHIQDALRPCCSWERNDGNRTAYFGGIDASINPGLTAPDSVGSGLENLLYPLGEKQFGDFGTLAAVSAVTSGQFTTKCVCPFVRLCDYFYYELLNMCRISINITFLSQNYSMK